MRIVVTGGICSGKSTVLDLFQKNGFKIASADKINVELLSEPAYIEKLLCIFPKAMNSSGTLDKAYIKSIIFADRIKREELNHLAHPIIMERIREISGDVVVEIPLFFESKKLGRGAFDKIVAVTAPLEIRINRVMNRDNVPREMALDIIKTQAYDDERSKQADFVVNTDCSPSEIVKQVEDICAKIKAD